MSAMMKDEGWLHRLHSLLLLGWTTQLAATDGWLGNDVQHREGASAAMRAAVHGLPSRSQAVNNKHGRAEAAHLQYLDSQLPNTGQLTGGVQQCGGNVAS
jgi:hypothetical protein